MNQFAIIDPARDKANDECGVFGIYKNNDELDVVSITHDALYSLQHRGHVSAGITVNDNRRFCTVKELGMVSEVINQKTLSKLPNGNIAVGHVRYTMNAALDRAANQPLVLRYKEGSLAIASNGAITNFPQIRSELERGGSIFQSNSNAELMAYVIATERIHTDNLEDAVLCAMKRLRGAYSTVICAPTRLIGFRDIHGFRPLCVGKLKDSYIITSESCVIETLGGELLRDVEPGEMVVIDKDGFHSYMAEEKAKKTSLCVFEYVYVARPDSVIDGISVFSARRKAGELLFKSASGIPYGMGFMKNKFLGRNAGTGMDKKKRLLHTKLTALKSNVAGKRIVVIDDSIVRGQTSQHIVNLLRVAGAKEIHMLVSSPPFVFPCHFGIDISDEKSLIANRMTVDEIRREIGADTFGYLSIDSLRKTAEGCHIGLCDGCFTKQFAAEVPTTFFVDKYATKIHK